MSFVKPDSMSGGDPYSFNSKNALAFQRVLISLLILFLLAGFCLLLWWLSQTEEPRKIILMRMEDAESFLSLGVPFQQDDLLFIRDRLGVVTPIVKAPDLSAVRKKISELHPSADKESPSILYFKGYGDTNGDHKGNPEANAAAKGVSNDSVPIAVIRSGNTAIAASDILDAFFRTNNKQNKPRLLVLDCSHAITNYRIGMFSNSFPALIAAYMESNHAPPNCWVLLPCGVNQLSFPTPSPKLQNSSFAVAFAEGLRGKADEDPQTQNSEVELTELYKYVWKQCAFPGQIPILLDNTGKVADPDVAVSLGYVIKDAAGEESSDAANPAESATTPKKSESSAPEESKPPVPDKSARMNMPGRSAREVLSAFSQQGFSSGDQVHRLLMNISAPMTGFVHPIAPQTATTSSQSSDASAIQPSGEAPDQKAKTSASPTDTPATSANTLNPESNNSSENQPIPLSRESQKWDATRKRIDSLLSGFCEKKSQFLPIRRHLVSEAEKDFRDRFNAGSQDDDMGRDSTPNPLAASTIDDTPLTVARGRANKVQKEELFELCLTAWDVLLTAHLHLPSYIEWHDHQEVHAPDAAKRLRFNIEAVAKNLEQLEKEILNFERPELPNQGRLELSINKVRQALESLNTHVTSAIPEYDETQLFSILRTPLLDGRQRDDVVNRLVEKLKTREAIAPAITTQEHALKDPGKPDVSLAVQMSEDLIAENLSAEDMKRTDASPGSVLSLYGQLVDKIRRPASTGTTVTTADILLYFGLASLMPADDDDRSAGMALLPTLPKFPFEPRLRLLPSNSADAERELIPGKPLAFDYELSLSDVDPTDTAADKRVQVNFEVDSPDGIEIGFRPQNGTVESVNESKSFGLTTDQFGKATFQVTASRDKFGEVASAVKIKLTASTNVGGEDVKAVLVPDLVVDLPIEEFVVLEVTGDGRIPQDVGSHRRTLRILPNTATHNILKLSNHGKKERTVRVEVYALKQIPDAEWTPGLLFTSDPSIAGDAKLFPQFESYKSDRAKVMESVPIASSDAIKLPSDHSSIPIRFKAPTPSPTAPGAVASSTPVAPATTVTASPDVSHGLFVKVIDLKEMKEGDVVQWVKSGDEWDHWLEVIPMHPKALFEARGTWDSSASAVKVNVQPKQAGEQSLLKTKVRYFLTDENGWILQDSVLLELSAQGYEFQKLTSPETVRSIFVELDGYPRSLRLDIACEDGRDTKAQPIPEWSHFRIASLGNLSEHSFLRKSDGFEIQKKNVPGKEFSVPFFNGKEKIPIGLQIDFPVKFPRNLKQAKASNNDKIVLTGSKDFENEKFPRDRQHSLTLGDVKEDGTLTVNSRVTDWMVGFPPYTNAELIDLAIGPSGTLENLTGSPDRIRMLIDPEPPEFDLSLSARSVEVGQEIKLVVNLQDYEESAPLEKIEFNIVDADNSRKPFEDAEIEKTLTRIEPDNRSFEIKFNPAKLMREPGEYLIKARATDALGQQSSTVTSEVFSVRAKPVPKEGMKDGNQKMGVVRIRFHVKDIPLAPSTNFAGFDATWNGQTLSNKDAADGIIQFTEETPIGTPVDVEIKWHVKRNSINKSTTISVEPVSKELESEFRSVDLSKLTEKKQN